MDRMRWGPRPLVTLTALALALALTACSSGGGASSPTTTAAPTTTTTAPPRSSTTLPLATTTSLIVGASTSPTSIAGSGPAPTALLADVRSARPAGHDRVVFEFQGDTLPSARVSYATSAIVEDGSGAPVSVSGVAAITVVMNPASGVDLSQPTAPQTYTGPTRFTPAGTTIVAELVRFGDFEGHLSWAIGVEDEVPFLVSTLSSPPRLVIDLQG